MAINEEAYKDKYGKVYALTNKNEDYFGTQDRYDDKGKSIISKRSSRLRLGNKDLSQSKLGNSKLFNKSESQFS